MEKTSWLLILVFGIHHVNSESCLGRCFMPFSKSYSCHCNYACVRKNDCCSDYDTQCNGNVSGSCSGRCAQTRVDRTRPCQCNSHCSSYGNCCPDFEIECERRTRRDSTNCRARYVTDNDLENISYELWRLDTNSFPESALRYNVQNRASRSTWNDVTPDRFFTSVNESFFAAETYQKLIALQDNYICAQGRTERVTRDELEENDAFLTAVIATSVGKRLFEFLDGKNLAGCSGLHGFKALLKNIWFGMYNRKARHDTSGFEHSFVGETKRNEVSGFHNWVAFYKQEGLGNVNYLGYVYKKNPRFVAIKHTWFGAKKPMGGFTIGTSPEIEFALYTLCFLSRPNSFCPIKVTNQRGNSVMRGIQTYMWRARYGQSYVASAYFVG